MNYKWNKKNKNKNIIQELDSILNHTKLNFTTNSKKETNEALWTLKQASKTVKLVLADLKLPFSDNEQSIELNDELVSNPNCINFELTYKEVACSILSTILDEVQTCRSYIRHQIHLVKENSSLGIRNLFQNKELKFLVSRRCNSYFSGDEENNNNNTRLSLVKATNAHQSIKILFSSNNEQQSKGTICRIITRLY